jgi:hypothetical protein
MGLTSLPGLAQNAVLVVAPLEGIHAHRGEPFALALASVRTETDPLALAADPVQMHSTISLLPTPTE